MKYQHSPFELRMGLVDPFFIDLCNGMSKQFRDRMLHRVMTAPGKRAIRIMERLSRDRYLTPDEFVAANRAIRRKVATETTRLINFERRYEGCYGIGIYRGAPLISGLPAWQMRHVFAKLDRSDPIFELRILQAVIDLLTKGKTDVGTRAKTTIIRRRAPVPA